MKIKNQNTLRPPLCKDKWPAFSQQILPCTRLASLKFLPQCQKKILKITSNANSLWLYKPLILQPPSFCNSFAVAGWWLPPRFVIAFDNKAGNYNVWNAATTFFNSFRLAVALCSNFLWPWNGTLSFNKEFLIAQPMIKVTCFSKFKKASKLRWTSSRTDFSYIKPYILLLGWPV